MDEIDIAERPDDMQAIVTVPKHDLQNITNQTETAMESVFQWRRCKGMKVTASKTQIIFLGTPTMLRTPFNVTVI